MRSIRLAAVALLCFAGACAKDDKAGDTVAVASASSDASASRTATASGGAVATPACLEGTWKKKDGDFNQTFTFNRDGTGEEVQSRSDTRTFKWTMKNENTVHITYTTAGSVNTEWDLNVDCPNNRFASLYSK